MDGVELGILIKRIREAGGKTQSELGDGIGVLKRQIQKYEAGTMPSIERLQAIRDFLNYDFFKHLLRPESTPRIHEPGLRDARDQELIDSLRERIEDLKAQIANLAGASTRTEGTVAIQGERTFDQLRQREPSVGRTKGQTKPKKQGKRT